MISPKFQNYACYDIDLKDNKNSGSKCFAGSQVPLTRKMAEKSRFGEFFTEEIQEKEVKIRDEIF